MDHDEISENVIDSLENSTWNTKKRILPSRPGRGQMMKFLQEKEPDEEDEIYNLIFAEKSSDEEFNPSQTELSEDSEIISQKNSEAEEKEEDEEEEVPHETESEEDKESSPVVKKSKPRLKEIRAPQSKRLKRKKDVDDLDNIVDIDLLDIDKIDEIEDMREKGIYEEDMMISDSDEIVSESEDEKSSRKKRKNKKNKKNNYKNKNRNDFDYNVPILKEETIKKTYRKTFIDDEEEDILMKKRQRTITQKFKKKILKKPKVFSNPNVVFDKNDPDTLIIRKVVFEAEENYTSQEEKEEDIMEYNDEFYRDQENINIQNEEENKKIIKKFKKPEKQEGTVAVKYNFMHEKLSQKDLLIEAIFTEYYNIQSLQEMQRLDDLNKKEMPTQGRREFTEYVRFVKRVVTSSKEEKPKEEVIIPASLPGVIQENKINEEVDSNALVSEFKTKTLKSSEMNDEQEIPNSLSCENIQIIKNPPSVTQTPDKKAPLVESHDNYVTFSNPLVYEKIFENFNKKSEPKEKKTCVITGLPAKYYDPLTKQHYSNIESFKIMRERYFQKEEDSLLFRIQTLSDFASQKKEKIKKLILSNENGTSEASKNLLNMVNRYGILRSDNEYFDKKVVSRI
jgi:vacuolar protein sorting-associated protein 72